MNDDNQKHKNKQTKGDRERADELDISSRIYMHYDGEILALEDGWVVVGFTDK